ncbi:SMI1/KNR4 family protein [Zobellia sp. 1_MG-2023]|uniref:SMI1/KNR4 family protein n=1 Tax=Zobellia sp. 1_MG-2023 TaxID=3062626 RepID=UPI0026E2C9AB|nr:SMI1/KNR4 family protein [Zobellia sp. 1_MG-2023]MDO6819024.1 SMI1/KNR4 family protein [Zobellia sp. 1_MG-2023]
MFLNCSNPISNVELEEIEKEIGLSFPIELKEHYLKYNGGSPVNEHYLMEDYQAYIWVNSFFSFKKSDDDWTIEEAYSNFINKKAIPNNFIPFADDLGGNQICINTDTGEVYIVYMDLGNPMEVEGAIRKIADNFQYFVDNLEEKEEEDV